MAAIEHRNIANADLHEPLGANAALAGQVYIFRTSSLAEWVDAHYASIRPEGVVAPTHKTLTTPTTYTALGFTGLEINEENGGIVGGQGPSITWNEAFNGMVEVSYNVCLKHTDAGSQPVSVTLMKNGAALTNYELVESAGNLAHRQFSDCVMLRLVLGDVITICAKVPAGNLSIHNAYMSARGVRE